VTPSRRHPTGVNPQRTDDQRLETRLTSVSFHGKIRDAPHTRLLCFNKKRRVPQASPNYFFSVFFPTVRRPFCIKWVSLMPRKGDAGCLKASPLFKEKETLVVEKGLLCLKKRRHF
jgi:hypothetical protein